MIPRKKNKLEIIRFLRTHKHKLGTLGVKKIGLFGSFAQNRQTQSSDIDFLVEMHKKSFDNYMDLKFFLESSFKRKVDLVLKSSIKPALKKYILNHTVYA